MRQYEAIPVVEGGMAYPRLFALTLGLLAGPFSFLSTLVLLTLTHGR